MLRPVPAYVASLPAKRWRGRTTKPSMQGLDAAISPSGSTAQCGCGSARPAVLEMAAKMLVERAMGLVMSGQSVQNGHHCCGATGLRVKGGGLILRLNDATSDRNQDPEERNGVNGQQIPKSRRPRVDPTQHRFHREHSLTPQCFDTEYGRTILIFAQEVSVHGACAM